MYRSCATEKSARQQRLLAQSLLATMQATPYGEICVTQLCEKAQLSRKTFYRLFGCKDDVLYVLIDHALTDFVHFQPTDVPILCGPEGDLHRFFGYWQTQKPLLDALYTNRQIPLLTERMLALVAQEHWDELYHFRHTDPEKREEHLVFFTSGLLGVLISWYLSGFRKSPAQMARVVYQMVYHLSCD